MTPTSSNPAAKPYHADLDADQLDAKLLDIELIAAEMTDINDAQRATLDELARR